MKIINNIILVLLIALQLLFSVTTLFAQKNEPISDFYQYANNEWINKTVLPENYVVINQVGILWEEIEKKSLEILSGSSTYELNKEHLYALQQLRNFYNSTSETIGNSQKRVAEVQKNFPMTYGIIFSKITVTQNNESMIREIIDYLTLTYRYKIEHTDIIGKSYKKFFLNKLDNLKFDIGAPSLSDFPKMPLLSKTSYSDNLKLAKSYQIELEKIQTDWQMPYETDCYYYAGSNKIILYAGMLYDFNYNDDISYLFATLGRTIAHEMTHAFDVVGENYDMDGKKMNVLRKLFSGILFSKDNRKAVHQNMINQFNKYSYHDSLFVNGESTLQENHADLAGVEVSIMALKKYLKDKNKNISDNEINKSIKEYFVQYARFWKEKSTIKYEIASYKRIHTPQKYRAIGPIYNQNEFYQLYDIDTKSEYYIPESKRISVW
jgi:predicted metalloendopeptidase